MVDGRTLPLLPGAGQLNDDSAPALSLVLLDCCGGEDLTGLPDMSINVQDNA